MYKNINLQEEYDDDDDDTNNCASIHIANSLNCNEKEKKKFPIHCVLRSDYISFLNQENTQLINEILYIRKKILVFCCNNTR
ncbi:hypothetical protein DERF_012017 [Dermatophagoides farinae]|uniref:Uncharacterized protein n=1 Tax=Dermatophagoides farinae TaxID=6954 RepID=A0A922KZM1_DERFA|nr:hypothetical protein DERF_012017 [Dermatophagoides farinae]